MSEIALVVMRLKDMWKMHPDQVEATCSKCDAGVGVYPSGQRVLQANPQAKIICAPCAKPKTGDERRPAGSWDEIKREIAESYRRS
jgi:hypothetical protein